MASELRALRTPDGHIDDLPGWSCEAGCLWTARRRDLPIITSWRTPHRSGVKSQIVE
jgi:hypothetical protein